MTSRCHFIILVLGILFLGGCVTRFSYAPPAGSVTMSPSEAVSEVRASVNAWATSRGDYPDKSPKVDVDEDRLSFDVNYGWIDPSRDYKTRSGSFSYSKRFNDMQYYLETAGFTRKLVFGQADHCVSIGDGIVITFDQRSSAYRFMEALHVLGARPNPRVQ